MKKQTGIWLDLRNAWIVNLPVEQDEEVTIQHITSEIEESAAVGGTRSRTPWGPQGGDNQGHIEERRHHEEKHFFAEILKHLPPSRDELVIFGPSEAKFGLENLLEKQHNKPQTIAVKSADRMTEHQIVAWVRDFFGRPAPRKQSTYGRVHEEKKAE